MESQMNGRILALDFGERRIGVAASSGELASPLQVIHRKSRKKDVETIASLVERESAELVVVGLPLDSRGEKGTQARKATSFARRLAASLKVPVVLWDERLTTVEAESLLRDAGKSSGRRRDIIDAAAAAVILQSYLDASEENRKAAEVVELPDRGVDE